MRQLLPLTICLALAAAPLTAQKTGSVNRNAPTISQSVQYTDGTTIKVSYFALATADGSTLERLLDKDRGARNRSRHNRSAEQKPVGQFTTSKDITLGGKKIAKGEYDLRITISDELKWNMSLTARGSDQATVHNFELKVGKTQSKLPCLQIVLLPKVQGAGASMSLSFSTLNTRLGIESKAAEATSRRTRRRRR